MIKNFEKFSFDCGEQRLGEIFDIGHDVDLTNIYIDVNSQDDVKVLFPFSLSDEHISMAYYVGVLKFNYANIIDHFVVLVLFLNLSLVVLPIVGIALNWFPFWLAFM